MPVYRSSLSLTVGFLLGLTALAPSALADANCDTYGKIALQQQKDNEAANHCYNFQSGPALLTRAAGFPAMIGFMPHLQVFGSCTGRMCN